VALTAALRAKLQNDRHKPRYIETLPGASYRFVAFFGAAENYRKRPSAAEAASSPVHDDFVMRRLRALDSLPHI
jgi:DNA-binding winged helix-turn-helix (wHTH) protein